MEVFKPKVCIVGIKGNMGRRYEAICKWLKVDVCGFDNGSSFKNVNFLGNPTHYIIASPTSSHADCLNDLCEFLKGKPVADILCEKPVIKTHDIHKDFGPIHKLRESGQRLFMVNNYNFYPAVTTGRGITRYNFYNSGGDGIAWDCIQLIHMAKGELELSNSSPYWDTFINGTNLIQDYICAGYVEMIKAFLDNDPYGDLWSYDEITLATKKVIAYEKRNARNSSKNK